MTFVRDGEIRRFVRCAGDGSRAPLLCSEPVLTRAELAHQLGRLGWAAVEPRIEELAWLDGRRFAAIFQQHMPGRWYDDLVLVDRGRLVREPVGPYVELGRLKLSPTGSRVAATEGELGGFVVVDRAGRRIPLALDRGSGIAWSPDDNWIAEAEGSAGIMVLRADGVSPQPIRIPVAARDVLWLEP